MSWETITTSLCFTSRTGNQTAKVLLKYIFLCFTSRTGNQTAKVFFHFVGATPRSTDLASFLQRLTKELKPDMVRSKFVLEVVFLGDGGFDINCGQRAKSKGLIPKSLKAFGQNGGEDPLLDEEITGNRGIRFDIS